MKNWKSIVEKEKSKVYVLPEGWDAREKIAEQMGVSDDQCGRDLVPMVKAGTIESQAFAVWDKITKRLVRVTAYRETNVKPKPEKSAKEKARSHQKKP